MNILLATIFAHAISDFLIQSKKTVEEKSNLKIKGFVKHYFEVWIPLILVLMVQFKFMEVISYSLIISGIHLIIDIIKVCIERINTDRIKPTTFVVDQLIHFCSVVFIIVLFYNQFNLNHYYGAAIQTSSYTLFDTFQFKLSAIIANIELYSIVYILFCMASGIFIGNFIKPFKPENHGDMSHEAGKYIGMFERFIIITMTILAQYSAIAFIIAAKSLARHEEFNERGFAEYYLLGTLLSIVVAVSGGLLLTYLVPFVI